MDELNDLLLYMASYTYVNTNTTNTGTCSNIRCQLVCYILFTEQQGNNQENCSSLIISDNR